MCMQYGTVYVYVILLYYVCVFLLVFGVQEMGGYFIVNGNERLIRMLIVPRRNYVSFHTTSHYTYYNESTKVQNPWCLHCTLYIANIHV